MQISDKQTKNTNLALLRAWCGQEQTWLPSLNYHHDNCHIITNTLSWQCLGNVQIRNRPKSNSHCNDEQTEISQRIVTFSNISKEQAGNSGEKQLRSWDIRVKIYFRIWGWYHHMKYYHIPSHTTMDTPSHNYHHDYHHKTVTITCQYNYHHIITITLLPLHLYHDDYHHTSYIPHSFSFKYLTYRTKKQQLCTKPNFFLVAD